MVVTRRGQHRLADPNAVLGGGRDSLHSPQRAALDYSDPWSALEDTARRTGGLISDRIDNVVAFIKATTGIDLSGPAALLTLPLEALGGAELGKALEVLGIFIPSLAGSDPATFDRNAAATEFIETVLNPTGLLASLSAIAEKLTGITNPADPGAALTQWGANLRTLFDGADLNAPGLTQAAGLQSWIDTGILPLNLLLGPTSPLPAWNLFGRPRPNLFRQIPLSAIGDFNPNLLEDPLFEWAGSVEDPLEEWVIDTAVRHVDPQRPETQQGNSVRIDADSITHDLLSDPELEVTPGQRVLMTVYVRWQGLVSTADPIQLVVVGYDKTGDEVLDTTIASAGNALPANSIDHPDADADGWVELSSTFTTPLSPVVVSIRKAPRITSAATAGTIWFSDALQAKTQPLPEHFTEGLPEKLAGFTPDGWFDAIRLRNTDDTDSPFRLIADLVTQGLIDPTSVDNPVDSIRDRLGALVDSVRQGADGTPSTGNIVTDLRDALTGLRESVSATSSTVSQIQDAMPPIGVGTTAGGSSGVIGNTYTDECERPPHNGYGPDWLTLGPTNPYGVKTDGHGWYWDDNGDDRRLQIGIYLAGQTTTDYQSVRDVMSSLMEGPQNWTGDGPNANNWLIARANDAGTRFVALRRFHNRVELYDYNNGVLTPIPKLGGGSTTVAVKPQAGARWELECGNIVGLRRFTAYMNNSPIGTWEDTALITPLGAGQRRGGQAHQSDDRPFTESTPGSITRWSLSDKEPPSASNVIGSGAKMIRTVAAAQTLGTTTNETLFPANVFDATVHRSGDITVNLAEGRFTVTEAGWYRAGYRLEANAWSGFIDALIYVNRGAGDVLLEYGDKQAGTPSIKGNWEIHLNAGDSIRFGYRSSSTSTNPTVIGESSGARTYAKITLLNRSLL